MLDEEGKEVTTLDLVSAVVATDYISFLLSNVTLTIFGFREL